MTFYLNVAIVQLTKEAEHIFYSLINVSGTMSNQKPAVLFVEIV